MPIVNAFGFLSHSRYMPDRRDLNRSFPGSDQGSLASLVADLFMREVVLRTQYGIDLHTAALHRTNLPQIRIAPDEPDLLRMAEAFGPPVVLISKLREGTLRQCARDHGVKVLLYEGGEALRFDEIAIRGRTAGILRVMNSLGMIPAAGIEPARETPAMSISSTWLRRAGRRDFPRQPRRRRAGRQGRNDRRDLRSPGRKLGGDLSDDSGIVIGRTNLPIVNRGDALFHIARMKGAATTRAPGRVIEEDAAQAPLSDEDEII